MQVSHHIHYRMHRVYKRAHCTWAGLIKHSDRRKYSQNPADVACLSGGVASWLSEMADFFICVYTHLISSRDSHSVLAFWWLLVSFTKHCNAPWLPLIALLLLFKITAYHDCHTFSQGTLISSHPQDMICVSDPNQNKLAVKPLDSLCLQLFWFTHTIGLRWKRL